MIQFDTDEIESYISSSVLPKDYELYLRLYETKGTSGLSETYDVATYPISESWDEGIGKEWDRPKTTEGCSWKFRKNKDGIELQWQTRCFIHLIRWGNTIFFIGKPDINMNVTSIAKKWFSGDNDNHGFLLRLSAVGKHQL